MDRLAYSKSINNILGELLRMSEEYVTGTSETELVNTLIREKNKVIDDVIKIIETESIERLNCEWSFNDK